MKLILASSSPRRAELLRDAGIAFEVCAPQVEEIRLPKSPSRKWSRGSRKQKRVRSRSPSRE